MPQQQTFRLPHLTCYFHFYDELVFYWGEKLCRRFSYLCRFLRRLVREMRLIFNAYSWHPLFSYLVYYQMMRMTKYFGKYFNAQIYIHMRFEIIRISKAVCVYVYAKRTKKGKKGRKGFKAHYSSQLCKLSWRLVYKIAAFFSTTNNYCIHLSVKRNRWWELLRWYLRFPSAFSPLHLHHHQTLNYLFTECPCS